jgi:hypothetical protein
MSVTAGKRKRKRQAIANGAVGSEHMATSGWVLAYILHWSCKPTSQGKAYSLLQGIIRTVCRETLPVGSSIVIKDGFLLHNGDDGMWDQLLSMLRQILKANSTSVTGVVAKDLESPPASAAVLWTLSSGLHRQAPNMHPLQGLQMLRDLSNILTATVASAMDKWARTAMGSNISTATLLQTHLRGKTRPRRILPILKHRLAQKRRPQAVVSNWKDDGTNVTMSPEATMGSTCSRYLHKVQETMKASTTIELLMDASRFGGTDNEIFVIFSPSRNIAAYAPPQARRQTRPSMVFVRLLGKLTGVGSPGKSRKLSETHGNAGHSRKLPATPGNSRTLLETPEHSPRTSRTYEGCNSLGSMLWTGVGHNTRRNMRLRRWQNKAPMGYEGCCMSKRGVT